MAHASPNQDGTERAQPLQPAASKPSQSLGKWIDNLLGDKKARDRAAIKATERRKFFSVST